MQPCRRLRPVNASGGKIRRDLVTPARAMQMAQEAGLDLVEISPTAVPPV